MKTDDNLSLHKIIIVFNYNDRFSQKLLRNINSTTSDCDINVIVSHQVVFQKNISSKVKRNQNGSKGDKQRVIFRLLFSVEFKSGIYFFFREESFCFSFLHDKVKQ